jgi:hypothetical protein
MESLWNPYGTTREQYASKPQATRQQHAFPAPAACVKKAMFAKLQNFLKQKSSREIPRSSMMSAMMPR